MKRKIENQGDLFREPLEKGELVKAEKEKGFVIEKNKEIKLGIGKNRKSGFAEVLVTYPGEKDPRKVHLTIFNMEGDRGIGRFGGKEVDQKTMKELKEFIFSLFDDEGYGEGKHIINSSKELPHKIERRQHGKEFAYKDD